MSSMPEGVQSNLFEDVHRPVDTVCVGANLVDNETMDVVVSKALGASKMSDGQNQSPLAENAGGGSAAFKVCWDCIARKYSFKDPLVVLPDGSTVVPEQPEIGYGSTYWLQVGLKKDGSYQALIVPSEDSAIKDARRLWIVKIAEIAGADAPGCVTQYHVGVFSVMTDGYEPDDVSTEKIKKSESEGATDDDVGKLQVKGWKDKDAESESLGVKMGLEDDPEGSDSGFEVMVRPTDKSSPPAFITLKPVKLVKVSVIIGAEINKEKSGSETDNPVRKLRVKRQDIYVLKADDEGEWEEIGEIGGSSIVTEQETVVKDVAFDTESHTLSQTKKTVLVVKGESGGPETTDTVFVAVPHGEHGGS